MTPRNVLPYPRPGASSYINRPDHLATSFRSISRQVGESVSSMAARKLSGQSRNRSRCSSVDRSMENIPEEDDEKPFKHFINKQVRCS